MPIGIITGSGTHALPGFADAELLLHETPFGTVEVSRGRFAGVGCHPRIAPRRGSRAPLTPGVAPG